MDLLGELLGFASMGLVAVFAIATMGVGAVAVRPVQSAAGYALIAAGAVRLLSVCCLDGAALLHGRGVIGGGEAVHWLGTLGRPFEHLVFWSLVGFAAYTVASGRSRERA